MNKDKEEAVAEMSVEQWELLKDFISKEWSSAVDNKDSLVLSYGEDAYTKHMNDLQEIMRMMHYGVPLYFKAGD